jgi:hypothetical protein
MEPALNARLSAHNIQLVTENAPGAGGQVGLFKMMESTKPTLGFFSPFFAIVRNTRPEKPYDYTDVNYIGFAGYNKMVIISGKHKSPTSMCLGTDKTVYMASSGVGSMSHVSGYYFARNYLKCDNVVHVPYKTTSDAYADLKAGRVDFLADFDITAKTHIDAGYFNLVHDVKTTDLISWHVFVANKAIPAADLEIIRKEFAALKADAAFAAAIESRFGITHFSATRGSAWLAAEFNDYRRLLSTVPVSKD